MNAKHSVLGEVEIVAHRSAHQTCPIRECFALIEEIVPVLSEQPPVSISSREVAWHRTWKLAVLTTMISSFQVDQLGMVHAGPM